MSRPNMGKSYVVSTEDLGNGGGDSKALADLAEEVRLLDIKIFNVNSLAEGLSKSLEIMAKITAETRTQVIVLEEQNTDFRKRIEELEKV